MDLSPVQLLVSVFGGGAGGSVITKAIDAFGRRGRSQAYTMGAVDHAVQTAMSAVTGQLERTEHRLEAVENQHESCQRDLHDLRNKLSERNAEIDRLMAGPIASYGDMSRGEGR